MQVDYCEGLKRFGFKESQMLGLLDRVHRIPFVTVHNPDSGARVATLNTSQLVDHLRAIKRTRVSNDALKDFCEELDRVWYCMLYYAGFDPQRDRGGPLLEHHEWLSNQIDTLTEALEAELSHDKVIYTETYPDAIKRYPRDFNHH